MSQKKPIPELSGHEANEDYRRRVDITDRAGQQDLVNSSDIKLRSDGAEAEDEGREGNPMATVATAVGSTEQYRLRLSCGALYGTQSLLSVFPSACVLAQEKTQKVTLYARPAGSAGDSLVPYVASLGSTAGTAYRLFGAAKLINALGLADRGEVELYVLPEAGVGGAGGKEGADPRVGVRVIGTTRSSDLDEKPPPRSAKRSAAAARVGRSKAGPKAKARETGPRPPPEVMQSARPPAADEPGPICFAKLGAEAFKKYEIGVEVLAVRQLVEPATYDFGVENKGKSAAPVTLMHPPSLPLPPSAPSREGRLVCTRVGTDYHLWTIRGLVPYLRRVCHAKVGDRLVLRPTFGPSGLRTGITATWQQREPAGETRLAGADAGRGGARHGSERTGAETEATSSAEADSDGESEEEPGGSNSDGDSRDGIPLAVRMSTEHAAGRTKKHGGGGGWGGSRGASSGSEDDRPLEDRVPGRSTGKHKRVPGGAYERPGDAPTAVNGPTPTPRALAGERPRLAPKQPAPPKRPRDGDDASGSAAAAGRGPVAAGACGAPRCRQGAVGAPGAGGDGDGGGDSSGDTGLSGNDSEAEADGRAAASETAGCTLRLSGTKKLVSSRHIPVFFPKEAAAAKQDRRSQEVTVHGRNRAGVMKPCKVSVGFNGSSMYVYVGFAAMHDLGLSVGDLVQLAWGPAGAAADGPKGPTRRVEMNRVSPGPGPVLGSERQRTRAVAGPGPSAVKTRPDDNQPGDVSSEDEGGDEESDSGEPDSEGSSSDGSDSEAAAAAADGKGMGASEAESDCTLCLSNNKFLGVQAIRKFFPEAAAAILKTGKSQAVTVHARDREGRLAPHHAKVLCRATYWSTVSLYASTSLLASLGVPHRGKIRLSREPGNGEPGGTSSRGGGDGAASGSSVILATPLSAAVTVADRSPKKPPPRVAEPGGGPARRSDPNGIPARGGSTKAQVRGPQGNHGKEDDRDRCASGPSGNDAHGGGGGAVTAAAAAQEGLGGGEGHIVIGSGREAMLRGPGQCAAPATAATAADGVSMQAAVDAAAVAAARRPTSAAAAAATLAASIAHLHGFIPRARDHLRPPLRPDELRLCGLTFHPDLAPAVRSAQEAWLRNLGCPLQDAPVVNVQMAIPGYERLPGPPLPHGLSRQIVCTRLAQLLGLHLNDAPLPEGCPELDPETLVPCGDLARGGAGLAAAVEIKKNAVLGVVGGYVAPRAAAEAFVAAGWMSCRPECRTRLEAVAASCGAHVGVAWRLLAGSFRMPFPAVVTAEAEAAAAPHTGGGVLSRADILMLGYGGAAALVNDPRDQPRAWVPENDVDSTAVAARANCMVLPISVRGVVLPVLVAVRRIAAGEQLLRDYGAEWWRQIAEAWEMAEDDGLQASTVLHAPQLSGLAASTREGPEDNALTSPPEEPEDKTATLGLVPGSAPPSPAGSAQPICCRADGAAAAAASADPAVREGAPPRPRAPYWVPYNNGPLVMKLRGGSSDCGTARPFVRGRPAVSPAGVSSQAATPGVSAAADSSPLAGAPGARSGAAAAAPADPATHPVPVPAAGLVGVALLPDAEHPSPSASGGVAHEPDRPSEKPPAAHRLPGDVAGVSEDPAGAAAGITQRCSSMGQVCIRPDGAFNDGPGANRLVSGRRHWALNSVCGFDAYEPGGGIWDGRGNCGDRPSRPGAERSSSEHGLGHRSERGVWRGEEDGGQRPRPHRPIDMGAEARGRADDDEGQEPRPRVAEGVAACLLKRTWDWVDGPQGRCWRDVEERGERRGREAGDAWRPDEQRRRYDELLPYSHSEERPRRDYYNPDGQRPLPYGPGEQRPRQEDAPPPYRFEEGGIRREEEGPRAWPRHPHPRREGQRPLPYGPGEQRPRQEDAPTPYRFEEWGVRWEGEGPRAWPRDPHPRCEERPLPYGPGDRFRLEGEQPPPYGPGERLPWEGERPLPYRPGERRPRQEDEPPYRPDGRRWDHEEVPPHRAPDGERPRRQDEALAEWEWRWGWPRRSPEPRRYRLEEAPVGERTEEWGREVSWRTGAEARRRVAPQSPEPGRQGWEEERGRRREASPLEARWVRKAAEPAVPAEMRRMVACGRGQRESSEMARRSLQPEAKMLEPGQVDRADQTETLQIEPAEIEPLQVRPTKRGKTAAPAAEAEPPGRSGSAHGNALPRQDDGRTAREAAASSLQPATGLVPDRTQPEPSVPVRTQPEPPAVALEPQPAPACGPKPVCPSYPAPHEPQVAPQGLEARSPGLLPDAATHTAAATATSASAKVPSRKAGEKRTRWGNPLGIEEVILEQINQEAGSQAGGHPTRSAEEAAQGQGAGLQTTWGAHERPGSHGAVLPDDHGGACADHGGHTTRRMARPSAGASIAMDLDAEAAAAAVASVAEAAGGAAVQSSTPDRTVDMELDCSEVTVLLWATVGAAPDAAARRAVFGARQGAGGQAAAAAELAALEVGRADAEKAAEAGKDSAAAADAEAEAGAGFWAAARECVATTTPGGATAKAYAGVVQAAAARDAGAAPGEESEKKAAVSAPGSQSATHALGELPMPPPLGDRDGQSSSLVGEGGPESAAAVETHGCVSARLLRSLAAELELSGDVQKQLGIRLALLGKAGVVAAQQLAEAGTLRVVRGAVLRVKCAPLAGLKLRLDHERAAEGSPPPLWADVRVKAHFGELMDNLATADQRSRKCFTSWLYSLNTFAPSLMFELDPATGGAPRGPVPLNAVSVPLNADELERLYTAEEQHTRPVPLEAPETPCSSAPAGASGAAGDEVALAVVVGPTSPSAAVGAAVEVGVVTDASHPSMWFPPLHASAAGEPAPESTKAGHMTHVPQHPSAEAGTQQIWAAQPPLQPQMQQQQQQQFPQGPTAQVPPPSSYPYYYGGSQPPWCSSPYPFQTPPGSAAANPQPQPQPAPQPYPQQQTHPQPQAYAQPAATWYGSGGSAEGGSGGSAGGPHLAQPAHTAPGAYAGGAYPGCYYRAPPHQPYPQPYQGYRYYHG